MPMRYGEWIKRALWNSIHKNITSIYILSFSNWSSEHMMGKSLKAYPSLFCGSCVQIEAYDLFYKCLVIRGNKRGPQYFKQ